MDFNIKVYIYDFNLKRQVTMNEFESIGLVTELTGSPNIQYVINDDSTFALTDFKVLKGQGSNLVQCAKVRYNGKIKLIYFTSEKKSLKNIVQSLDSDSFITVIANLISSVNDIKSNGFLELSNLALTFDKIFVDSNTLSVSLIYLPINNSHSDTVQTENELRTEIIKFISSVPAFATEKMNRISSYLSNGTLSLGQLYRHLCEEVGSYASIKQKVNVVEKKEVQFANQPTLRFRSINAPVSINLQINSGEYVIGKSADKVDGVISFNKAISRVHCKITYQNGNYYITDLGSANGTFVNSKRILAQCPEIIKNGDAVRLANSDFLIEI